MEMIVSYYDWIHFNQIEWYRQQSAKFTEANGSQPLPALAFFHIGLPEYEEIIGDGKTYGSDKEGVSGSNINSGMFASFIEAQDVMGVFVGHDHDNDFIGINKDIALGFGRVTGADAYGSLKRGARIIKLYEGQRKFDSWITTTDGREATYYYPSGLNSEEEQYMTYEPAVKVLGEATADGKLVVDNDGGHSGRRAEGKIALEKGLHEMHLLYFEDYMGQELEVGYSSRSVLETPLPDEILFLPE